MMKKIGFIFVLLLLVGCENEKIITKEEFMADKALHTKWLEKCIVNYHPEKTCDNAKAAHAQEYIDRAKRFRSK